MSKSNQKGIAHLSLILVALVILVVVGVGFTVAKGNGRGLIGGPAPMRGATKPFTYNFGGTWGMYGAYKTKTFKTSCGAIGFSLWARTHNIINQSEIGKRKKVYASVVNAKTGMAVAKKTFIAGRDSKGKISTYKTVFDAGVDRGKKYYIKLSIVDTDGPTLEVSGNGTVNPLEYGGDCK